MIARFRLLEGEGVSHLFSPPLFADEIGQPFCVKFQGNSVFVLHEKLKRVCVCSSALLQLSFRRCNLTLMAHSRLKLHKSKSTRRWGLGKAFCVGLSGLLCLLAVCVRALLFSVEGSLLGGLSLSVACSDPAGRSAPSCFKTCLRVAPPNEKKEK